MRNVFEEPLPKLQYLDLSAVFIPVNSKCEKHFANNSKTKKYPFVKNKNVVFLKLIVTVLLSKHYNFEEKAE